MRINFLRNKILMTNVTVVEKQIMLPMKRQNLNIEQLSYIDIKQTANKKNPTFSLACSGSIDSLVRTQCRSPQPHPMPSTNFRLLQSWPYVVNSTRSSGPRVSETQVVPFTRDHTAITQCERKQHPYEALFSFMMDACVPLPLILSF